MGGYRDDELFVRWVQLVVLSPINRLHSSNSEFTRKEPWSYAPETERIVNQWLRLRHGLFPYLYTMNYRTHAQRLPLVQPMYYSHPKCQAAYEVPNQYWFGSEFVVAPITQPIDESSRLAKVEATVTDRVELMINGQTLIHDNADVPDRINRLLQCSYLGTGEKEALANICASNEPLHKKTP